MQLDDGIFGRMPQVGRRRAMTVLDAMFWDSMFWDGRVKGALVDPQSNEVLIPRGAALEAQVFTPVLNAAEMSCKGRDWNMVTSKLAAAKPLALASELPQDLLEAQQTATAYPDLFAKAFGDNTVTATRIAMAIATYERTLTGNQTPWDRWLAGDDNALSAQQKRGFQMFARKGQCACCHTAPLFGLPALVDDAFHEVSWDGGGAEMGLDKPGDYTNPTFRTVTTRNAGLREASGLLHDGVAPGNSLEDLVAAYNMKPVRNVHFCRTALNLSDAEQADLVEFVRNGLTDPRAAQELAPFDRPKLASEQPP
jgi:cytochrome c peroxidase